MSDTSIASCGYICYPRDNNAQNLIEYWKNSDVVKDLYFATATFAFESKPYFPNNSNHYILVKYDGLDNIVEGISKYQRPNSSLFLFNNETELFEKYHDKVSYVSMYYTRYDQDNDELRDIAGILARRDMVVSANLGNLKFMNNKKLPFIFPHADNIIILEVNGKKSHQSDQNYCEKTRKDVARKGIPLINLVSFSILEKLR
ncbi:MAG TPA: hypothetical protein VJ772_05215 [Nitrososphaeraceae archaeon]|nr:hypothetical protein [Nitrososphaeraceae archaeon]